MKSPAASRSREMFDGLVGRRTGIVRELRLVPTIDGEAAVYHAAATIADAQPHWTSENPLHVGGAGLSPEEAICAALGEGLERYVASAYRHGLAPLQTAAELPHETLSPATLVPFSGGQRQQAGFPYVLPTAQTRLWWLLGRRLDSGVSCGVPAFAVYLPYQPAPGEPLVGPGLSTGLACGDSAAAALLGGLCEVIERDALALCWLKGLSPRPIPHAWLVQQAGALLPPADAVRAYDVTSEMGVPVVLVIGRGPGPRGPILSVGSACHPDGRQALRKAVLEAASGRVYVRHLLELDPHWRPQPDFANVTDFSFHARLYSAQPDLVERAFNFLDHNPALSDLPERSCGTEADASDTATCVIGRLHAAGHQGAWVDLTPDWAASLGLHVVKVVIPSLLPLHGHHGLAYLGHPRLATASSALPGALARCGHGTCPYPHPFP